ncbi:MAG: GNAT family N-acetyltransferase [Acidimicrobiia bacterium]
MDTIVRPIGEHEYAAAQRLAVAPKQRALVAPVASSLDSMDRYPGSEPLGILVEGVLVGFMMGQLLADESPGPTYLIWDLFVDCSHQRRGVGRSAVAAAAQHARNCGAMAVMLAYEPVNTVARDLYRSCGFVETGSINADGEHEMVMAIAAGPVVE